MSSSGMQAAFAAPGWRLRGPETSASSYFALSADDPLESNFMVLSQVKLRRVCSDRGCCASLQQQLLAICGVSIKHGPPWWPSQPRDSACSLFTNADETTINQVQVMQFSKVTVWVTPHQASLICSPLMPFAASCNACIARAAVCA